MLEFTTNKVYILTFLLTIFFVLYGVKIPQNKQNAQNAHLVESMRVESKNRSKIMKISNKQLQHMVSTGIISKEQSEKMVSEGIASGFSRGKVEVCKQVGNFLEIFNQLQIWFDTYEDDINKAMVENGHQPVKKVSINIAK